MPRKVCIQTSGDVEFDQEGQRYLQDVEWRRVDSWNLLVLQCLSIVASNHDDLQTGLSVSIIPHYCFASTFYVFIIEA